VALVLKEKLIEVWWAREFGLLRRSNGDGGACLCVLRRGNKGKWGKWDRGGSLWLKKGLARASARRGELSGNWPRRAVAQRTSASSKVCGEVTVRRRVRQAGAQCIDAEVGDVQAVGGATVDGGRLVGGTLPRGATFLRLVGL